MSKAHLFADMTFIHEGNHTLVENLINFEKMEILYQCENLINFEKMVSPRRVGA